MHEATSFFILKMFNISIYYIHCFYLAKHRSVFKAIVITQYEYDIFVITQVRGKLHKSKAGQVLITKISYKCTWAITCLYPKGLYQSMLLLWQE